jgi:L-ascorbate metabolism protein UlaG (beta-lactamase superfamily)
VRPRFLAAALAAAWLAALSGCSGVTQVDPATYAEPGRDQVTFWGHACFYIDAGGTGIVTDPVFKKNLWQRRRFIGAPPEGALARTKVVLISHAHDDHLSAETLAKFPKDVVVLCPAPAAKDLAKAGIAAKALKPGEDYRAGDVRIIAVAAHHPGTHLGTHAAADGRALGWVIVTPSATVFYSGDTNYVSSFADVGWTYAPDIAILNVNGHLRAPDAARAAWATRAPVVIPSHWGAYGYWVVGGNRQPRDEDELKTLLGDRLRVISVGKSLPLEGAAARR